MFAYSWFLLLSINAKSVPEFRPEAKIIGRSTATTTQFPSMAYLKAYDLIHDIWSFKICAASVSSRYILTAESGFIF